jgi:hypothetical protein
MSNDDSRDGATDLVWGAAGISKIIGRPVSATFHLLEKGVLPARKVGGRWLASRRRLLAIGDGPMEPAA